jgi:lipopolysaccharide transport system permease protein
MAVTVLALSLVYSQIFGLPVRKFMPYVCAGLIVWNFIGGVMVDAGTLFSGPDSYITQVRLPYTLYACRFVFSKVMLFVHELPIFVVLLLYFSIWPGAAVFFTIPGFVLLVVNALLASLTIGMVSARFRDVPRMIASLMQVLFLVTPIIWMPDQLGYRFYLAEYNPFFHLVEMVRAPMLGVSPSTQTICVTLAVTAINCLATVLLFLRFRARIAFWI